MTILLKLVQPHAVTMFILALICLVGYGYPGYRGRSAVGGGGFLWLLWLIGGIMAVVAWVILIFS